MTVAAAFGCILILSVVPVGNGLRAEGNIDLVDRFAWSENAGWIDFSPEHGGVTVRTTHLSGYAWAENIGWIKLGSGTGPYANTSASNWGVNVNDSSRLSGFAWSENVGWINFAPAYGGVSISGGRLDGYAWSENIGWISLRGTAEDTTPYAVRAHMRGSVILFR